MKIGPSVEGYQRVDLKCLWDTMEVSVATDEEFQGVIYTRGSYSARKPPCFMDPTRGKKFRMKIPLDSCNTKNESGLYTNVLVLQHDDDLIMPGDAAFKLECDFRTDKEIEVTSSINLKPVAVSSRIEIADADPGGKPIPESKKLSVANHSSTVTFRPKKLLLKEEL
ncbi:hypothetical protein AAG570_010320 [Ranatra chinensis]|uniref:ZP domain-containing protein n=1 Tax=Ranatra chinensis TaxID=642074 RepID=A0ABD0YM69_9HEMI